MRSEPRSARTSPVPTGCAGCPRTYARARSTMISRPSSSWIRPASRPNVTSRVGTSRASARASSRGYRSPPPKRPPSPNTVGATCVTLMLRASLITLGDPERLTGGYLYHRRMAAAAGEHDPLLRFESCRELIFPFRIVPARAVLRRAARDADVIVVDSIAAALVAP